MYCERSQSVTCDVVANRWSDTSGKGGRARAAFVAKKRGPVRFYAKVPNQRDYPYVRGRSDTKRLRVKG